MRFVLFTLLSLIIVSASPSEPSVPEAAVVQGPPPPPPPFPEYHECLRWIDLAEKDAGRRGLTANSLQKWALIETTPPGAVMRICGPDGDNRLYEFQFHPNGGIHKMTRCGGRLPPHSERVEWGRTYHSPPKPRRNSLL